MCSFSFIVIIYSLFVSSIFSHFFAWTARRIPIHIKLVLAFITTPTNPIFVLLIKVIKYGINPLLANFKISLIPQVKRSYKDGRGFIRNGLQHHKHQDREQFCKKQIDFSFAQFLLVSALITLILKKKKKRKNKWRTQLCICIYHVEKIIHNKS